MTIAEPQHPGFLELALQHRYPLRHLSTAELHFCRLNSYLAKVHGDSDLNIVINPCNRIANANAKLSMIRSD